MINIVLALAAHDILKVRVIFSIGEKLRLQILLGKVKRREKPSDTIMNG
jgi:hypothetical protein